MDGAHPALYGTYNEADGARNKNHPSSPDRLAASANRCNVKKLAMPCAMDITCSCVSNIPGGASLVSTIFFPNARTPAVLWRWSRARCERFNRFTTFGRPTFNRGADSEARLVAAEARAASEDAGRNSRDVERAPRRPLFPRVFFDDLRLGASLELRRDLAGAVPRLLFTTALAGRPCDAGLPAASVARADVVNRGALAPSPRSGVAGVACCNPLSMTGHVGPTPGGCRNGIRTAASAVQVSDPQGGTGKLQTRNNIYWFYLGCGAAGLPGPTLVPASRRSCSLVPTPCQPKMMREESR